MSFLRSIETHWYLTFVSAAAVSLILVHLLARGVFGTWGIDIPNERSLHTRPVPRLGGLGLLASAAVAWLIQSPQAFGYLAVLLGLLSAVSFVDDLDGLPVSTRLIVQSLSALVFLGIYLEGSWLLVPLACVTLIWMSNLYNFMDGSDGLAGGMTLIGFAAYGISAASGGYEDLAKISFAISGAALGFLVWNFHKASIFMGDSGSVPLGFAAAALGMIGWERGAWPMWFPALVFSPFIVDASVTLIKRWRRGERLSQAHKSHYYQRALQLGLGHRGTALAGYALMLGSGSTALMISQATLLPTVACLIVWGLIYLGLFSVVDQRWNASSQ